jgi:hypothetical protein
MLYAPSPQRRTGCFTPFGCGLVLLGIIICVILTVYPNSPFRPNSSGHPSVQPTPLHHTTPKQTTPKKGQITPVPVEHAPEVDAPAIPTIKQITLAALPTNNGTHMPGSHAAVSCWQRGEV